MTIIRERIARAASRLVEIDVVLFSTFSFNADFFEQNVLPALFGCEPGEKRSVRDARVHKGLITTRVAAFYDASMLKPSKCRFRYAALPVYLGLGKLFHPKNVMLFGKDSQGERWIYVAAMSANLSISGWGQNCEGFADTWIHARSEQPAKELGAYLQWLQHGRHSRSDILLAALRAFEELRERRALVDPDRIPHDAKAELRLYFSPLHPSLWSFLKEEYGPMQSVIAGSPYWGDSSQAAGELEGVSLELIAARCAPRFQAVNLGQNTLAQLYPGKAQLPKVRAWRGERGRFHHLKVYQIQAKRGQFIGLGSCNFTDRGQFWSPNHGNVESMLFDQVKVDLPETVPLPNKILPDLSQSDDPPESLSAYVSLQYDWKGSTFRWQHQGSTSVLPITLQIPDGANSVLLTPEKREGTRKGALQDRVFTFTFKGGEAHTGLVEELNLGDSTLVYGRVLPARDILESWRNRSAAEPSPPTEDDDGTGENSTAALPEGAVEKSKQKEEPFDWFLFYRCIQDMRNRLAHASGDHRLVTDLAVTRSDSVLALCDSVFGGTMPSAAKWLVAKECRELLKPCAKTVPLINGRLKRLKTRMDGLKVQLEKDLENALHRRRVTSKASDVLAWYDQQLSKEVQQ